MHSNVSKDVYINGANDPVYIANCFADHFQSVYVVSSSNNAAKLEYETLLLVFRLTSAHHA